MKRFIINGKIDDELVRNFITFFDVIPQDENILIYLSSQGGSETGSSILIDIINSAPERFEIFALKKIFSAAFDLFFLATCKRRIDSKTVGMCHLSYIQCEMMKMGLPYYDQDKAWLKGYPVRKQEAQSMLNSLKVPLNQQKKILNGQDVYFQPAELSFFLRNHELSLQKPPKESI